MVGDRWLLALFPFTSMFLILIIYLNLLIVRMNLQAILQLHNTRKSGHVMSPAEPYPELTEYLIMFNQKRNHNKYLQKVAKTIDH